MKPFIDFKYQPHSSKAEDKKIRDWRVEHDPNDRALTNWNIFVFVTTLITGGILATALVYLAHQYRRSIFAFFRMLDDIPTGYQFCIALGLCVVAAVSGWLVWRGKKDSKTTKNKNFYD